jgi:hypothetical protein
MGSQGGPGRACPLSYRYGAAALARAPSIEVDTLWVAGGLYGNPFALDSLLEQYEREPGRKALVFNGDFHWFDIDPSRFAEIQEGVGKFVALRGNVETELASPAQDAGCGCGYPEWVGDATVDYSNRIMEKLKLAAHEHPHVMERLGALPMHLTAQVGGERIAVVHGDGNSLAGWDFSEEALATRAGLETARRQLDQAGARVFASSHTCLPVLQSLPGARAIVNNGAAGMPNFRGTRFGLATRISVAPGRNALYAMRLKDLHVEAVKLDYDGAAWERAFVAQWPEGSDAHRSYFERIVRGPDYSIEQALRAGEMHSIPRARAA